MKVGYYVFTSQPWHGRMASNDGQVAVLMDGSTASVHGPVKKSAVGRILKKYQGDAMMCDTPLVLKSALISKSQLKGVFAKYEYGDYEWPGRFTK